jgi:hypothetical protein
MPRGALLKVGAREGRTGGFTSRFGYGKKQKGARAGLCLPEIDASPLGPVSSVPDA